MVYVLLLQSFCCQETHYRRKYGVMFYTNCTSLFVLLSCLFLPLYHFRIILFVPFLPLNFLLLFHNTAGRTISTSFSPIRPRFSILSTVYTHIEGYYIFISVKQLCYLQQSSEYSTVTYSHVCLTNRIKECVSVS